MPPNRTPPTWKIVNCHFPHAPDVFSMRFVETAINLPPWLSNMSVLAFAHGNYASPLPWNRSRITWDVLGQRNSSGIASLYFSDTSYSDDCGSIATPEGYTRYSFTYVPASGPSKWVWGAPTAVALENVVLGVPTVVWQPSAWSTCWDLESPTNTRTIRLVDFLD